MGRTNLSTLQYNTDTQRELDMAEPLTPAAAAELRNALQELQGLLANKANHQNCYLADLKHKAEALLAQANDELDAMVTTPPPQLEAVIVLLTVWLDVQA